MGISEQKQLFTWKDIDSIGDLQRLEIVLKYIPDQQLIQKLEKERKNGQDKFPIRPVWNSILAGIMYQHVSTESLRRELARNGQLRELCEFEVTLGIDSVPTPWAYSRFLSNLLRHENEINTMFNNILSKLKELLPDLGTELAIDGKALPSLAKGDNRKKGKAKDRRSEMDADWGKKTYKGKKEDGSAWKKMITWFGFKLHLIVDSIHELPVAFRITKASVAEQPIAHEMLAELKQNQPAILERTKYLTSDKGYDSGKLYKEIYDTYGIKPVIDIRNTWKDGEETKVVPGTENVVYDYKGNVSCICLKTGEQRRMAYGGFEKKRGTLKYICPREAYGISCKGCKSCSVKKSIRIDMEVNRRIFTPLARSSYAWKKKYARRTAVERVNSRIDVSLGFERHYIRGEKKMQVRCGLSLCLMLVLAYGRIMEDQKVLMRSFVKAA